MDCRIIIFDFDGVVIDSIDECLLVSYYANNGADICSDITLHSIPENERKLFKRYRYLVGPAFEYLYLWKAIKSFRGEVEDYYLYLKNNVSLDTAGFQERFFNIRRNIQENQREKWIKLNPVYPGIVGIIEKLSSKTRLFISSTKDEGSIVFLCRCYGIPIPENNIFGNESGIDKMEHIKTIAKTTKYEPGKMVFIDDNYEHLKHVQKTGIRCYLAGWGYNTSELKEEAREMGIIAINSPESICNELEI